MQAAARLERERRTVGVCARWIASLFAQHGNSARQGVLSLLDQSIVSVTNFAATILIARYCGAQQLGVYSLTFTLMVLVICAHQSLLMTPYTVFVQRLAGMARCQYTGSVFLHHAMLTPVAMVSLLGLATFFQTGYGPPGLALPVWVLAAAVPFILLREFGRRHAFAHLQLRRAIAVDGMASALQIIGMMTLARAGWLGPASTMAVVGMACGSVGIMWGARARQNFVVERGCVFPALLRNLKFGRWIFASQLMFLINSYLIQWLLAFQHDTAATGVFAACASIVLLSNPFIQGAANVLNPWVAMSFAEGDSQRLRHVVFKATLVIGIGMGLFYALIHFGGEVLLSLLYGPTFAGHQATLQVLAAGALCSTLTLAMLYGLFALNVPQISLAAGVASLSAMLLTGFLLPASWGPVRAAWAMATGNVVASVVIALAFHYFVRQVEDARRIAAALPHEPRITAPDLLETELVRN